MAASALKKGGIYTLGPSEGTVISNNSFHDIYAYSYGGWGLYTDEGSTGITMEYNLVDNTKTGSFHQHYGKDNVVRNNILVCSENPQVAATRVEEHLSFTFENNIVYWKTGELFGGPWTRIQAEVDYNCYFNAAGDPITFAGMDRQAWQALGYDEHSIIADPLFVDPEQNDYRLQPDSPALDIGFKPFDLNEAGVYGDPEWIALAAEAEMPMVGPLPSPPPISIHDDFEATPAGGRPRAAEVHVEGRGDVVEVTSDQSASGNQCLKVVDVSGLEFSYNPHFCYAPNHKNGETVCKFDLLVEPRVRINYEWRDWRSSPYRVGPTLNIEQNRLIVGGETLLELPTDTWVHLEVAADLGKESSGKWNLIVTIADHFDADSHQQDDAALRVRTSVNGDVGNQRPQEFSQIANGSTAFEQLTWIGLTSNATSESEFYVDNLSIENK